LEKLPNVRIVLAPMKVLLSPQITAKGAAAHYEYRAYTKILIEALKEITPENQSRFHNKPPQGLHIDPSEINGDTILDLISELQLLNRHLAMGKEHTKFDDRQKVEPAEHIDNFLDGVAKAAGRGSAWLLIGAAASLLAHIEVEKSLVTGILSKIK
jgi:hypothetical protein